jgi:hypothetical protein
MSGSVKPFHVQVTKMYCAGSEASLQEESGMQTDDCCSHESTPIKANMMDDIAQKPKTKKGLEKHVEPFWITTQEKCSTLLTDWGNLQRIEMLLRHELKQFFE